MNELSVYGIALVPVIVGLTELLKRTGVPNKFLPVVALFLGLFLAFYYLVPGDPKQAVLLGIVLGLSSIGLFSGTKNTIQGIRKR